MSSKNEISPSIGPQSTQEITGTGCDTFHSPYSKESSTVAAPDHSCQNAVPDAPESNSEPKNPRKQLVWADSFECMNVDTIDKRLRGYQGGDETGSTLESGESSSGSSDENASPEESGSDNEDAESSDVETTEIREFPGVPENQLFGAGESVNVLADKDLEAECEELWNEWIGDQ